MTFSPSEYDSINDIKSFAKGYFFTPDAMRFFNSRVLEGVYYGRYFITSEKFDSNSPRLYTIRMIDEERDIQTVGDFQAYKTPAQARKALDDMKKAGKI